MFNPTTSIIHHCVAHLQAGYRCAYGNFNSAHTDLIGQIAATTLTAIARTDALYHNVEHTILVALVGQEILRGKHLLEGGVSNQDWLNFITSLLCHDIGYIKGICHRDQVEHQVYTTGVGREMVAIAPGATDAKLTPYHVDRSKQFVEETFTAYQLLDVEVIKQLIELTRFPIPNDDAHRDTANNPGLARAADLIGQLGDPRYLEKLPALFHEFEECGANRDLGYHHPGDLRSGYPKFFHTTVAPSIKDALPYLGATQQGRQILKTLHTNVAIVQHELAETDQQPIPRLEPVYSQERYHFMLHQDEDMSYSRREDLVYY